MLEAIIMTTLRMIPVVTLFAALGLLVGIVTLAVVGAIASRRRQESGVALSPEAEEAR